MTETKLLFELHVMRLVIVKMKNAHVSSCWWLLWLHLITAVSAQRNAIGVVTTCHPYYFQVDLLRRAFPGLQSLRLRLYGQWCRPSGNSTHVSFRSNLHRCGTIHVRTATTEVYRNAVYGIKPAIAVQCIFRREQVGKEFKTIERNITVSRSTNRGDRRPLFPANSFNLTHNETAANASDQPHREPLFSDDTVNLTHVENTVRLDMFLDSNFTDLLPNASNLLNRTHGPIAVFFQLQINSTSYAAELGLFIEECRLQICGESYLNTRCHTVILIQNGCCNTSTTKVISNNTRGIRFMVNAPLHNISGVTLNSDCNVRLYNNSISVTQKNMTGKWNNANYNYSTTKKSTIYTANSNTIGYHRNLFEGSNLGSHGNRTKGTHDNASSKLPNNLRENSTVIDRIYQSSPSLARHCLCIYDRNNISGSHRTNYHGNVSNIDGQRIGVTGDNISYSQNDDHSNRTVMDTNTNDVNYDGNYDDTRDDDSYDRRYGNEVNTNRSVSYNATADGTHNAFADRNRSRNYDNSGLSSQGRNYSNSIYKSRNTSYDGGNCTCYDVKSDFQIICLSTVWVHGAILARFKVHTRSVSIVREAAEHENIGIDKLLKPVYDTNVTNNASDTKTHPVNRDGDQSLLLMEAWVYAAALIVVIPLLMVCCWRKQRRRARDKGRAVDESSALDTSLLLTREYSFV